MEGTRSFNDILKKSSTFLVCGLKKPEPILRNREEDPIEGRDNYKGHIDEREPSNVDDIKA